MVCVSILVVVHKMTSGRKMCFVTEEQVSFLRSSGLKWSLICRVLRISRSTLYRRLTSFNLGDPQTFSDEDVDNMLCEIIFEMPNSGEIYLMGILRARKVFIPRWRLRERLKILDPVGRSLRRRHTIKRRVYNVKGANYLW